MRREQKTDPRVTIRIIHDCNFRCRRCSTFSAPGRNGRMRLPSFRRSINILAREQFRGTVNISGGEPTLHPRLSEMLRYASKMLPHSDIVVFTNGSWVGTKNWKYTLNGLLAGPNVIVNYSLDRQHAEGASRAAGKEMETALFDRARQFVRVCRGNFRIAFKGTQQEAEKYLRPLGKVPIYLIQFQKNPARRPKKAGVFAIEVNQQNRVEVFLTLGHIPRREPIGGLEMLTAALHWNREACRDAR
jgi:organic radical activating enzyme